MTFKELLVESEVDLEKLKGKFFGIRWESDDNEVIKFIYTTELKNSDDVEKVASEEKILKNGSVESVWEMHPDDFDKT